MLLDNYSIKVKLILTLLITSLVTPFGLLAYILLIENQVQEQRLVIRNNQQEKVFFFENSLHKTYSDILYISRIVNNALKQSKELQAKQLPKNISFFFKNLLKVNPLYQQIRLIDNKGQEQLRYNQRQGVIFSTQSNNLQNKSKYAYVSETLKLKVGEIYISNIELNQENGVIETPFNPTLRLATKIEDTQNGFEGLIVINISAQHIIDKIKKNSTHDIYLIDQKGHYIIHPKNTKQWSATFNKQFNFNNDFPALNNWQQFIQKNGPVNLKTTFQQLHIYPINSGSQFNRQWFLVTATPSSNIWNHIQQETILISAALIGIFLSILLGSYISRRWIVQPIHYMESIYRQLIEGKSIELTHSYNQQDELGLLCRKLHKMAQILSKNQENNKSTIQSLNNEVSYRKKVDDDLNIYKAFFEYSSEAMMIKVDPIVKTIFSE